MTVTIKGRDYTGIEQNIAHLTNSIKAGLVRTIHLKGQQGAMGSLSMHTGCKPSVIWLTRGGGYRHERFAPRDVAISTEAS